MHSEASLQKTITDQIIAALENNLVPWKHPGVHQKTLDDRLRSLLVGHIPA